MKTYYIFRHGETFVTKSLFGYGWYGLNSCNVHILTKGIPPIKRLAEYLKDIPTDMNVSSDFLRCRETAKVVTDITGKKFTFDLRLRDLSLSSLTHFVSSLRDFLSKTEISPAQNILICTHGSAISVITNLLLTGKFSFTQILNYPKPGILTIIKGDTKKVLDFN